MHATIFWVLILSKTDLLSHDAFGSSNDLLPASHFRVSGLQGPPLPGYNIPARIISSLSCYLIVCKWKRSCAMSSHDTSKKLLVYNLVWAKKKDLPGFSNLPLNICICVVLVRDSENTFMTWLTAFALDMCVITTHTLSCTCVITTHARRAAVWLRISDKWERARERAW